MRRNQSMGMLARALLVVCVGAITLLSPSRAQAQMGAMRAMAGGMTTPSITARHMKLFAQVLGLGEAQEKAAMELLGGYETEYLAAIKRFQEIQQAGNQEFMQSGDLQGVQRAVMDSMKKFNKRTESLEKNLIADLKTLLDEKQLERWPTLERMHRRMTTVNWGSLSGESVDLFDLVEGLRLEGDGAASAAPVLAQYELELDRELKSRNASIQAQVDDWLSREPMDFDMDKMRQQAKELREAGVKIVDLNKRYAAQIRPLLPEPAQAEFEYKVKLASFPIVYRRSHAARVLEVAQKIEGLDAGQLESLRTLQAQYERDVAPVNDRWAAAIYENQVNPADDNPFAQFMPNRRLPEDIKDAKEARDDIDERTIDSVKALLTEEQRKLLPKESYRPELDFDAVPGGN